MAELSDYVTEGDAARMLNFAPGTGNVWRHLREHAPHIELVELFGYTAVHKVALQKYAARLQEDGAPISRKKKQVDIIRKVHQEMENRS